MKKLRLICMLLCVLMLFAACQTNPSGPSDGTTGGVTDGTESETNPVETDPPTDLMDLSQYKVIMQSSMDSSLRIWIKKAFLGLREKTGVLLTVDEDTDKEGSPVMDDDLEILIGETNRVESARAKQVLDSTLSYMIKQDGNKIVIYGGCEEAIRRAVTYFVELVTHENAIAIEKKINYTCDYMNELYPEGSAIRTIAAEYQVVYPNSGISGERQAANQIKNAINQLMGSSITTASDTKATGSKEIVVGFTDRVTSDTNYDVGYYDYVIYQDGDRVILLFGSEWALERGVTELIKQLQENTLVLQDGAYFQCLYEDWAEENPIAKDLSLFTPSWAGEHTAADWMYDFDEKLKAVCSPTSGNYRLTAKVHRGDRAHYPDGSLEGYASSIIAGVDAIECDIRFTKDGVAILLHDESLKRTTNCEEFIGKANYPKTDLVSGWTYAQLMDLNLTMDNSSVTTPYKVPTLYDFLYLASGRVFVQIQDKTLTFLNNEDKNIASASDGGAGIYKMACDTDSKLSFLYWWGQKGTGESNGMADMNEWASNDPTDTEFREYVTTLRGYLATSGYALREDWWPKDGYSAYGNGVLDENSTRYGKMFNLGYRMVWTENPVELCKYIKANYQPVS